MGQRAHPIFARAPISSRPRQRSPADAALRAPAEPRQLLAHDGVRDQTAGRERAHGRAPRLHRRSGAQGPGGIQFRRFLPPRGAPGLAQQHLVPSVGAVVHQGPGPTRVPRHAVRARDVPDELRGDDPTVVHRVGRRRVRGGKLDRGSGSGGTQTGGRRLRPGAGVGHGGGARGVGVGHRGGVRGDAADGTARAGPVGSSDPRLFPHRARAGLVLRQVVRHGRIGWIVER
mmetsp:Transcript_11496/g.49546  ORF Transcript_11496/g.49546 Transcript_11496/m.49546 type:complete len:230 (-) Transcript_11496:1742-2431(-)